MFSIFEPLGKQINDMHNDTHREYMLRALAMTELLTAAQLDRQPVIAAKLAADVLADPKLANAVLSVAISTCAYMQISMTESQEIIAKMGDTTPDTLETIRNFVGSALKTDTSE